MADRDAVRGPGDGGGRIEPGPDPGPIEVGSPVELSGALVVGDAGVQVGGSIHLLASPFWGWSAPQTEVEGAEGYTTWTAPAGVVLRLQSTGDRVIATVTGRALASGERVSFVYGSGGTARADRFAEVAPALWVGVDGDGDGFRAIVRDGALTVRTVAGPPARVVATLPSTAAPFGEVTLRVAVLDHLGNAGRPVDGVVRLLLPDGVEGPTALVLRPEDGGVAQVRLRSAPGIVSVGASLDGLATAWSNPLVVREGAEPILWADLHVHTALSDGTGAPAEVLAYARDVAGLDVVALTDHDHWGMVFLDGDAAGRRRLAEAVREATSPDFLPLLGFEWTSWLYGHRNVVFFGEPPPTWPSSLDDATSTPAGLLAALAPLDALAVPHHPAGGPIPLDWASWSPLGEPVVEITSVHGQSGAAHLPGPIYDAVVDGWVEDHVKDGITGWIGSSDAHDGHPGLTRLAGGGAGLAALEGAERTPDSVRRALREGRTWATDGARIVLRVQPVGGRLSVSSGPPELELRVIGTAALASVEVLSTRGPLVVLPGNGTSVFHASAPLTGLVAGDRVWVRVVQEDGRLAWSSPRLVEP